MPTTRQPPESEPLSLEAAKLHLRVDHDAEDELIEGLVSAAREHAEAITKRSLASSEWTLHLDRPAAVIELPRPPALEVLRVEYDAPDGTVQELPPEAYQVNLVRTPARLRLLELPTVADREGAVRVVYKAGYTDETLPKTVAHAMKIMIATWFETRQETPDPAALPSAVKALLSPHRVQIYG